MVFNYVEYVPAERVEQGRVAHVVHRPQPVRLVVLRLVGRAVYYYPLAVGYLAVALEKVFQLYND